MSIEEPDLNKMKEEFEKKSKDEQKEILYEDQLKANTTKEILERSQESSEFEKLCSKLDNIMGSNQQQKEHIVSEQEVKQATERVELMPI